MAQAGHIWRVDITYKIAKNTYEYVLDEDGHKKLVKVKIVIANVCGSTGDSIYPPFIAPGETARWAKCLYLQLLVFRKESLLEFYPSSLLDKKILPIILVSDTLVGNKKSFEEACELFTGDKSFQNYVFYARDVFHILNRSRTLADKKHADFKMFFGDFAFRKNLLVS